MAEQNIDIALESSVQAALAAAEAAKTAAQAAAEAAQAAQTSANSAAAGVGGIRGKCTTVGTKASESLYSGSAQTKTLVNITGKGRIEIYNMSSFHVNDTSTLTVTIDGASKDIKPVVVQGKSCIFEFNDSFKLVLKLNASTSYDTPHCTWQLFE